MNDNRFGYDGVEVLDFGLEQIRSILTVVLDPEYHDRQLEYGALAVFRSDSSI